VCDLRPQDDVHGPRAALDHIARRLTREQLARRQPAARVSIRGECAASQAAISASFDRR
jgi:hypothetical protein